MIFRCLFLTTLVIFSSCRSRTSFNTSSNKETNSALDESSGNKVSAWFQTLSKSEDVLASAEYYEHFTNFTPEQRLELLQDWYAHPIDRKMKQRTFGWVNDTVDSLSKIGFTRLEPLLADPVIFQNFSQFYDFLNSNKESVAMKDLVSVRKAYLNSLPKEKLYRGMVITEEQVEKIGNSQKPGTGIVGPYFFRKSALSAADAEWTDHLNFLARWFLPRSLYDAKLKEWAEPLGPIQEAALRVQGGFGGLFSSFTLHKEIAESVGYWASGAIDIGTPQKFGTYLPTNPKSTLYIFEIERPKHRNVLNGPYWTRAERKKPSTLALYKKDDSGNINVRKFYATGEHRESYEVFIPFSVPSSQIVKVEKFEYKTVNDLPPRFKWE
jgi:hypothetical protein